MRVSKAAPRPATRTRVKRAPLPYVQVSVAVMTDARLSPASRALYALLCTYANFDTRKCWPLRSTLAEQMGWSTDTLDRHVKQLESADLLEKEVRSRHGGERAANLWTLLDVDWQHPDDGPH